MEGGREGRGSSARLSAWVAALQQYITIRCLEEQSPKAYADVRTAVRVMAILYKANQLREGGREGGRTVGVVPLAEFYNAGALCGREGGREGDVPGSQ